MTAMRRRWDGFMQAWTLFTRALQPWEQEGSLRWIKPACGDWELHGSTLPPRTGAGEPEGPLSSFRW